MPRLNALISALNEQDGIERTVASLKGQTVALDRIVVLADNCSDETAERALSAGAEVQADILSSRGPRTGSRHSTGPRRRPLTSGGTEHA